MLSFFELYPRWVLGILCQDRESKTAKTAAPIKSISLSVPKPHKKEETLNLSKVSRFLFNSFYIRRLQKQLFFLPYKSLYFERYATVPMLGPPGAVM